VDKAPKILREDAERFLEWVQAEAKTENRSSDTIAPPTPPPEIPRLS